MTRSCSRTRVVQNFRSEQTIAFHNIARTVFEAAIERGELGLEEAFQTFTKMVLALAVEDEASDRSIGCDLVDVHGEGDRHMPKR